MIFKFPEVRQSQANVKTDRPIVVLPLDRVREGLPLRVALNAYVIGLYITNLRGIQIAVRSGCSARVRFRDHDNARSRRSIR